MLPKALPHSRLLTALSVVLLLASVPSQAQIDWSWFGGGDDDNWSTGDNWEFGNAPTNGGVAYVRFISNRRTPIVDDPYEIAGISFESTAFPGYSLSGEDLTIGAQGIRTLLGTELHTINNRIVLGVNQSWAPQTAPVVLAGELFLANKVLTIEGAAPVILTGNANLGFIDVAPGGEFIVRGSIAADLDNLGGRLVVGSAEPQFPGSNLQFQDASLLSAEGTQTAQVSLQVTGQTTYDGSGDLALTNGIRGTGSLRVAADPGARLAFGAGYLTPFAGAITIESGTLAITGAQPGVPALTGPIAIGDDAGDEATFDIVAGAVPGDFYPIVQRDAELYLRNTATYGPVALIEGELRGGRLQGLGDYQLELVTIVPDDQPANIGGRWNTPTAGGLDSVILQNGTADPDLVFNAVRPGPGGLLFAGAGHVEMTGAKLNGEGRLRFDDARVTLARPGASSDIASMEFNRANITTTFDDQFGNDCVVTLRNSTLTTGTTEHTTGGLVLDESTIESDFATDGITVRGDIDALSTSTLNVPLVFPLPTATVSAPAGVTLTFERNVGSFGSSIQFVDRGVFDTRDVGADVTVFDGTLRSTGDFGALTVGRGLEIPATRGDGELSVDDIVFTEDAEIFMTIESSTVYSKIDAVKSIAVDGTATLDGFVELDLGLDASIPLGSTFDLIRTGTIIGSFATFSWPQPPANGFWDVVYPTSGQKLTARLRATDGADLEFLAAIPSTPDPTPQTMDVVTVVDFFPGYDVDLDIESMTLDGVVAPSGGTITARIVRRLDDVEFAVATATAIASPDPQTLTFALEGTLPRGNRMQLKLEGDATIALETETPARGTFRHSQLLTLVSASRGTTRNDRYPRVTLTLPGTAVGVEPSVPTVDVRALAVDAAPNPFNPRTQIRLDLPQSGAVRLDVIDVRGRFVTTLADEVREAGRHTFVFDGVDADGRPLASGVYFARAVTSAGVVVRKLALVR